MTTYFTNNPVGSTEVKDLYDNAENLDCLVVGTADSYPDRLGVSRKSWKGMENDFLALLAASGFETDVLTYTDGVPLTVDRPTQLIERASDPGNLYSVKLPSSFPVELSGTWVDDEPLLVVRTDQSLRQDLASAIGATLVAQKRDATSFDWALASRIQLNDSVSILEYVPDSERAGLVSGASSFDCTSAFAAAAEEANGKSLLIPDGVFTGTLDLTGWSGTVIQRGTIKAPPGTVSRVVDLTLASGVTWYGGVLDMAQTDSTLPGDARAEIGFYCRDSRDVLFVGTEVINVRVGRPWYISGTSAVTVNPEDGAKRILLLGCKNIAFPYNFVDEGTFNIISSDFYTGDNGGLCLPVSNGVKVADYKLDASVAYQPSTSVVVMSECYWESHDRLALLNCRNVYIHNCQHRNFFTRGIAASPTVYNLNVDGGYVSGNAAIVNINYACSNIRVNNIEVRADQGIGQKHGLRVGVGSNDILFSNITGFSAATASIVIEGAKRVRFSSVNLRQYPSGGGTSFGLYISGGLDGNAADYVTDDISIDNCNIESIYALKFDGNTGTATVAHRGVSINGSKFDNSSTLFNGSQPTNGQIDWADNVVNIAASAQSLSNRAFSSFRGGNIGLKMWGTYAALGATTYPTFTDVYFASSRSDGNGAGDSGRNVGVEAYIKKVGQSFYQPLLYGVDWFIDGTMSALDMQNQIRITTPSNVANGDTIYIKRLW